QRPGGSARPRFARLPPPGAADRARAAEPGVRPAAAAARPRRTRIRPQMIPTSTAGAGRRARRMPETRPMKNCLWIALLVLAGCATHRETAPQTYDFGLAQAPAAHTLSVQVPEMRAPEWLDGTAMLYRLAYRDPRALSPYSTSRWAGTPASMLTLRLRQQLGNLPGAKCQLATQLAEFSQTFDSASDSRALPPVQAVLHVAGTPARRLPREFRPA